MRKAGQKGQEGSDVARMKKKEIKGKGVRS